jgi:hypothetical protein
LNCKKKVGLLKTWELLTESGRVDGNKRIGSDPGPEVTYYYLRYLCNKPTKTNCLVRFIDSDTPSRRVAELNWNHARKSSLKAIEGEPRKLVLKSFMFLHDTIS